MNRVSSSLGLATTLLTRLIARKFPISMLTRWPGLTRRPLFAKAIQYCMPALACWSGAIGGHFDAAGTKADMPIDQARSLHRQPFHAERFNLSALGGVIHQPAIELRLTGSDLHSFGGLGSHLAPVQEGPK